MFAVAEATRTLGAVVAGFFVHGLLDMTYVIQIFFSLIVIILIDWLVFSLTFLLLGIVLMLLAPLLILKRNDLT